MVATAAVARDPAGRGAPSRSVHPEQPGAPRAGRGAPRLPAMTDQGSQPPFAPPFEPPTAPPAAAPVRRGTPLVVWIVVLLVISIAGAGLILSVDHAPTEEGRPELTYRGHALVAPRLAAMSTDTQALAAAGDAVATAGRDTLTRLRALDATRTQTAIDTGDAAVADVLGTTERMVAARRTLLDGTTLAGLPAADRVAVGTIDAAIAAAGEFPGYWQQIGVAASDPLELLQDLDAHDAKVDTATKAGTAGRWPDALAALDDAQGLLQLAHAVRESAHKAGLDVSTLDDLLDRLDTYDQALVDLYTILQGTNGQTTAESQAALARVRVAQASLPLDQSAMVVILSDLAGPTITPVLLSIESARGALRAAVDAAPQPSDAGPVPVGSGPVASAGVSS